MPRLLLNVRRIIGWAMKLMIALLILLIMIVAFMRTAVYFDNRIMSENGIDEGIYVSLGGQEQYLLIRGEDIENPVLIWLHGGPAGSDSYVSYDFAKYLVDEYTVVCWDQRGCGRTYFRNADRVNQTATFEQALLDLDELVDYVSGRFSENKVIIVGHSYGSLLGSEYVLRNPEKVSAYVGVGQFVAIESDLYSYEDAHNLARQTGDDTSAMEAAYEHYLEEQNLINLLTLRGYVAPYHVAPRGTNTIMLGVRSPYMGVQDLRWFLKQLGDMSDYITLNQQLFDYLFTVDIREMDTEFKVPVGFISGDWDWTTPVKYTEEYYSQITAPEKQFRLMEGCGHAPQHDDPELFSSILEEMLTIYLK